MTKQELPKAYEASQADITLFKMGVGTLQNFRSLLAEMGDLGDQFKLGQAADVSRIALDSIQRSGIDIFSLLPDQINFATLFQFGEDKAIRIHRLRDGKKVEEKPTRENNWDFFNQVLPHIKSKKPDYIDTL